MEKKGGAWLEEKRENWFLKAKKTKTVLILKTTVVGGFLIFQDNATIVACEWKWRSF